MTVQGFDMKLMI